MSAQPSEPIAREVAGLTPESCANTDRELWREREGDFYANSIHLTRDGKVGINVGGHVYVASLSAWNKAMQIASGDDNERAEATGTLLNERDELAKALRAMVERASNSPEFKDRDGTEIINARAALKKAGAL